MKSRNLIPIILIFLTLAAFSPELFRSVAGSTIWGSPSQIVGGTTYNSLLSTGLQASNGTMWLAWETNQFRGDSLYDIAYQTFTNGVWSASHQLTGSANNISPAFAQLQNGTILLFWGYKPAASFLIYYERFNGNSWSGLNQVSSTVYNDTNPAAAVGRDGTLWLVWTRTNSTCNAPCTDQWKQLYYKTLKNGAWSAEAKLSTDNTQQNWAPSVIVGKDSLVRVAWSKGLGSQSNYQVYYKTYNSTSSVWSSESKVESSTDSDEHPSLLQDRNGTIWLFWGRKHFTSSLAFYYFLEGQYSYNGGATWCAPGNGCTATTTTQWMLTNTATNVDSLMPNAVQNLYNDDIYLFYTTDLNAADNVYALISNAVSPVQDLFVKSVTPSSSLQFPGTLNYATPPQSAVISFTVAVTNLGDSSQIVSATLTVSNTTTYNLGLKRTLAAPGQTISLVWSGTTGWNTTNANPGRYTASVSVAVVAGETPQVQYDNYLSIKNSVRLLPLADVDMDGIVSLTDVSVVFFDYGYGPNGATCGTQHCLFFGFEDLDNNGIIDLIDAGIAAKDFGLSS